MKLLTMTIDNFKGIKHFDFEPLASCPNGQNVVVAGANGTGKSTLQDAYWWLLTGKNAAGNAAFDVYPIDAPDGVEASVEGKFETDAGETITLRRTMRPNTPHRRGDAAVQNRGNKTSYEINGVPKAQKDYIPFVTEHFGDEDTLLTLSKLHYFATALPWSDRRKMLIDLFAPHVDDIEVIKAHEELAPLGGYIGAMTTVEDYAAQAKAKRKLIRGKMEEIPARIDEAERGKPEMPPEVSGERLPVLGKRRIKLNGDIAALESGESASALRRRIAEVEAKAQKARANYFASTVAGSEVVQQQAKQLREKVQSAENALAKITSEHDARQRLADGLAKEVEELRAKCMTVWERKFDPEATHCPTCGQALPSDRIAAMLEEFNVRKVEEIEKIQADGREKKALLDDMLAHIERDRDEISEAQGRLDTYQEHLAETQKSIVSPPAWEDTVDAKAYDVEIKELRDELATIQSSSDERRASLMQELDEVNAQISAITQRGEVQKQIDAQDKRIEELKAEESRLGAELAGIEQRLQLAERFVQLQAADIEALVNASFHRVKWVLFDVQVNGGIAPCCRATINGVDYEKNANTASQYNGGLDIINTLSEKVGRRLPVWIDNAESCTQYDTIKNQVIRLQVSAGDTELRITEV